MFSKMIIEFLVLQILGISSGEVWKPFAHFLSLDKTEVLLYTKTEEALIVRSSYKSNGPNRSYLSVYLKDLEVAQVVNVTKMSSEVTNFKINLLTKRAGETSLIIQLWDSVGGQDKLIEEINDIQIKVIFKPKTETLLQLPLHFDSYALMMVLPTILLNKCAFGCKIEVETLQIAWKKPLPILLGGAIQFFVMPFCGFIFTRILALSQALSFGFVMTCTCPGGGGGYLFALLLEGDITLAIVMTCASTLLALIMMPLNSFIYSRMLGLHGSLHIPVSKIVTTLLFIVIPISVGIIIKRKVPQWASYLEKIIKPFSFVLMSIGIYLSFRMGLMFIETINLEVFFLGLLIPALGLLFGYSFSKMFMLPLPVCKTVAIEGGALNSFLALAIIQLSFPQHKADLASVAPFTIAMCSGCEMLFMILLYKAKKITVLNVEDEQLKSFV
ncbi:sodium/bile acid cotransporter 5 [Phascolarctos cinereus]|uniref:Sodium/bile acid cotransporter 5 n=1 Tax=Phascolarctos cinereus TaxID=38626 RepID=A0A6P5L102_PHACI|nr:sodium/bile acid cotransporter 5 [Phascolarctos cinereus]